MELKTAKDRFFFFLLMILFLPLLQHSFGFVKSGPLEGEMTPHPDIRFRPRAWLDGSYQKEKTLFVNDSVGFRPDLVRMINQIDFWIFKKLPTVAYVGNNGYLFNREYIDEYEGRTYTDDVAIRATLIKLKRIQDTLERMNKTFIFAYAPSKAYFMPENIPLTLRRSGGPTTSVYEAFRRLGDSLHIKQIDYNALFAAMKDTSKNPLFTRLGAHWSSYGSLLATDTLIKYIERERNIRMPHLVIAKLCYAYTKNGPENDLAKCCNLIFPLTKEKLCYPEYHYSADSTTTKLNMIIIGDSFGAQWLDNKFPQNVATSWEYWYYFRTVWVDQNFYDWTIPMDGHDWQRKILDADCMIITYNPTNLLGQTRQTEFIEKIYGWLFLGGK